MEMNNNDDDDEIVIFDSHLVLPLFLITID